MSSRTKRILRIYLPIAIVVILIAGLIAFLLLRNTVKAKDYFNALSGSNHTKQVQTTTIKDGETLIYEKIETIVFDGSNVYHKIDEKQLSADFDKDYDQTITEFYYSKNKIYYFEDNIWKEEDFSVSSRLKTYRLNTDYFSTLKFNKKIEKEGVLQGNIKDDCVEKVVSGIDLKDMSLTIIINKQLKVQKFDILAKTQTNRDVEIKNVYTYFNETVNMPV